MTDKKPEMPWEMILAGDMNPLACEVAVIEAAQARALFSGAYWIIEAFDDAAFCGADMDDIERAHFERAIALLRKGLRDA